MYARSEVEGGRWSEGSSTVPVLVVNAVTMSRGLELLYVLYR